MRYSHLRDTARAVLHRVHLTRRLALEPLESRQLLNAGSVIHEIMYHPASENDLEEYIELHNPTATDVDLTGWRISDGVQFDFPAVTLSAGDYLVVAADVATFAAKYPGVANVVGGWTGHLSNRGERIELLDSAGNIADELEYADEGDWGVRSVGPDDFGHTGWIWLDEHDGGGRSLELVNTALSNEFGQNWSASLADQGSPGAPNGVAAANTAPLVLGVAHAPLIPRATDNVTVTARIVDELPIGSTATVNWRADGQGAFNSVAMRDDGAGGDAIAGDNVYTATIPAQADGSVVGFYVRAADAALNARTWPAPIAPTGQQLANALYQVEDSFDPIAAWTPGSQPIYRLIMTEAERAELEDIGDGAGNDDESNAQMNGTFISADGGGMQVRYNVGLRNRGHGSRDDPPNNYRINFVNDQPWQGVAAANINSKYVHSQLIGSVIFRMAGFVAADASAVQIRVNGQDLAEPGAPRMFGSYVHVEPLNANFVQNHFPDDSDGNLYRNFRTDTFPRQEADLRYEGTDPDNYRDTYFKATNEELDDWSDIIRLTDVLNNAPDEGFLQAVSKVIDTRQWLRYIALDSLLQNRETGLNRGIGDDYAFYRGIQDTRFRLIPHDLDTVLGQGNNQGNIDESIFNAAAVAGLNRLLTHPDTVPLFYQSFIDLVDEFFNPQVLNPLLDQVLGGFVPQGRIDAMKQFVVDRSAAVLAQIPQEFNIRTTLPLVGGLYQTTNGALSLNGVADAAQTRSVLVGGHPVSYSALTGTWSTSDQAGNETRTLVNQGSTWSFLDDGSDQETAWRQPNFDDRGWDSGPAQLGYGDGDEATAVASGPAGDRYITTYFRQAFDVENAAQYSNLIVRLLRDDGAVIYLNGEELFRSNMPDPPEVIDYMTPAFSTVGGADEDTFFLFNFDASGLVEGRNVLAVEIHQRNGGSTDISFDLELQGVIPAAGESDVRLNPGVNRLLVETFDGPAGTGNRLESDYLDVWYEGSAVDRSIVYDPPQVDALEMLVRDSYLPGVPILVRVEALDESGNPIRELWDATVQLTTDRLDVGLSTNEIQLRNGFGSALVHVDAMGDFTLTAALGGRRISRSLASLAGAPTVEVAGMLPGASTDWSGVVHVTGDVLVPVGHTLTVHPGTLILIDGNSTPLSNDGADIDVRGTLNSLGTALAPVTFTAADPTAPWGEIHHDDASPSLYRFTNITRAGHAPRGGHTNTGPAIRTAGSTITFDHTSITDTAGKIMQGSSSVLEFYDSHFARSVMGPEVTGTSVLFQDGYIFDMLGRFREDGVVDDDDGFYVHRQAAGQEIKFLRTVVAGTEDDGIDSLGADVIIQDSIIRDITDKGVSYIEGDNTISGTLIVNVDIGVSAKGQGGSPISDNALDHVTIVARSIGIQAEDKFGIPDAEINYDVVNSIIRAPDPVFTDYDPAAILIDYTNLSEPWPGMGNVDVDPLFVNPGRGDYRLQPGSPGINAGDPASVFDADGSIADQGVFTSGIFGAMAPAVLNDVTLGGNTIMTPWGSPYTITGTVTVSPRFTLYILPGTSVYFAEDAELVVQGQLRAAGTKYQRVRLTGIPGAPLVPDIRPELPDGPPKWDGIHFEDSISDENLISFADIEYAQSTAGSVQLVDSEAVLDNLSFFGTRLRMVNTDDSSVIIRNSVFPDMFLPSDRPSLMTPPLDNGSEHINIRGGIPDGGHVLIERNLFGTNKGHNDVIDIDSNRWPAPVAVIRNNVFTGGGDEAIDGGGDILIEGNLFLNFQKDEDNTGSGDSNVITTGDVRSSRLVIVRNTFVNVDHVVNFKNDSYGFFENNTVVGITPPHLSNPDDPPVRMLDFSVINFLIPNVDDPQGGNPRNPAGIGAYTSGNIMVDVPQTVFGHVDMDPPNNPNFVSILEVWNSLVGDVAVFANADLMHNRMFQFAIGDPRFVNAAAGDYRLAPGSPGLGTGPNGLDMGAHVPSGASISGEPFALTARDHATLTIGGPGIFSFQYRVNDGPWSEDIQIFDPSDIMAPVKTRTYQLALSNLADGTYTVYVRGRQYDGQFQAVPTASKTWSVDSSLSRLVINEVMAANIAAVDHFGTTPDMIELYNAGGVPINLAGMSISDDPLVPSKFVFPAGTMLLPDEYLVLYADAAATPGLHLGFSLNADGDGVYLFDSQAAGGAMIDSVEFGPQIADLSIGRAGHEQQWTLTRPTFADANVAQPTGDSRRLAINEWFTGGDIRLADDYVELYNADPLPVSLAGLYLTDDPVSRPDLHQIAPLSYVAGLGHVAFIADGAPQDGPHHVDFRLSAVQEIIGLYAADLSEIDKVIYFSQTDDFSQGRDPDGAAVYQFFALPTPGAASPPPAHVIALDNNLRITELMYHPAEGTETEFIELRNTGNETLDLTGVRLDGGISFTFPQTMLAPGAYVVVVNDLAAFQARHPGVVNVAGEFTGNLSNGGEDVVLQLPAPYDAATLRFDYDDAWYPATDGDGFALVIRDASANPPAWNTAAGWQTGAQIGGTPGRGEGDPAPVLGDTNGDGRVNVDDLNNVRNNFGAVGFGIPGDTNGDGRVNIDDLNNVRNNFGAGAAPVVAGANTSRFPLMRVSPYNRFSITSPLRAGTMNRTAGVAGPQDTLHPQRAAAVDQIMESASVGLPRRLVQRAARASQPAQTGDEIASIDARIGAENDGVW